MPNTHLHCKDIIYHEIQTVSQQILQLQVCVRQPGAEVTKVRVVDKCDLCLPQPKWVHQRARMTLNEYDMYM